MVNFQLLRFPVDRQGLLINTLNSIVPISAASGAWHFLFYFHMNCMFSVRCLRWGVKGPQRPPVQGCKVWCPIDKDSRNSRVDKYKGKIWLEIGSLVEIPVDIIVLWNVSVSLDKYHHEVPCNICHQNANQCEKGFRFEVQWCKITFLKAKRQDITLLYWILSHDQLLSAIYVNCLV